ncbi:hypothetical protein HP532_29515, partial [Pseudomonas sp. CrR25]|nr:hypothetical protein [Pseudomonas sp. CrR25]
YLGDEGQRSLQVASSTNVAINDNGKRLFEDVANANRVLGNAGVNNAALPTPPLPATTIPGVPADQQRVFVSPGLVENEAGFNNATNGFRSGEPYSLVFVSGKEFRIYDAAGADVTSEIPGGGAIDPLASGGNVINFRGIRFQLDVVLQEGDNSQDLDNLLADIQPPALPGSPGIGTHSFTLGVAPTEFAVVRASTNAPGAVINPASPAIASPADQADFNARFPTSGVVLRFDGTDYEVYSQPYKAGNPVLDTVAVTVGPPDTINVFGVSLEVSGAPA